MMSCAPLQLPHTFVRTVKPAFEDVMCIVFWLSCTRMHGYVYQTTKSRFLRFFGFEDGNWGWGWALFVRNLNNYARA